MQAGNYAEASAHQRGCGAHSNRRKRGALRRLYATSRRSRRTPARVG